ncbi:MAG TPA: hypothetical protein VEY31_07535 [Roseococcus sp.]|nr:hypothetical protein [Roseococcus sp.]
MPAVFFVVPLYGKAGFLPYLLDGTVAQEGGFTRDVIHVDDGSPDDSLAVARWPTAALRKAQAHPSVRLAPFLASGRVRIPAGPVAAGPAPR